MYNFLVKYIKNLEEQIKTVFSLVSWKFFRLDRYEKAPPFLDFSI